LLDFTPFLLLLLVFLLLVWQARYLALAFAVRITPSHALEGTSDKAFDPTDTAATAGAVPRDYCF
jgi:hypothetical protein